MRLHRFALLMVVCLLLTHVAPRVALAIDPDSLVLPVAELGAGWSVTPGAGRRLQIASADAYTTEYQNRVEGASPRRVKLDIRIFPDEAATEAFLAGFSGVGAWQPLRGLGDGSALYTVGPISDAQGRHAGAIYWFRVAYVAAQVQALGMPDIQTIDALARAITLQQEAWIRQQLGQSPVSHPSPGLTALPTPPARRIVNDCERFLADVTIPDGSQMAPGQSFEKIWRVENCGETTWTGYRAVRVAGTFGPEAFDIPPAAPGETIEIAVTLQAPTAIGEHVAAYQLLGPGYPFGGFTVVIDVANCHPRAGPKVSAGEELTPRGLLLDAADLSGAWCVVSEERAAHWSAVRFNSSQYASPTRMQLWVSVWPHEGLARQALLGIPKGILVSEDTQGYRFLESAPWEVEGGVGERMLWSKPRSGFVGADYVFQTGHVVGWAQVSGGPDQLAMLDADARIAAMRLLNRIRQAVAVAAPLTVVEWPTPEAMYAALLREPLSDEELPGGLVVRDVRGVTGVDRVGPGGAVGTVQIELTGADPAGSPASSQPAVDQPAARPEALIFYTVYPDSSQAEAAFKQFSGMAYVFLPRSIPTPARCTAGGPLMNQCVTLVGNVLVYGDARRVDLGDASQPPPADPTADGMTLLGLRHLERVLAVLPWADTQLPAPRREAQTGSPGVAAGDETGY